MEHLEPAPLRKPARWLSGRALGLALIFLTAFIWVAASFVSQLLVNQEEGQPSYNVSPFLLTYLSTSIFTIFLPLVQLKSLLQETWLLRRSFKYKPLEADDELSAACEQSSAQQQQQQHQCGGAVQDSSLASDLDLAEAAASAEQASAVARASTAAHKEALAAALQCFMLWFIAQYLFNKSLSLTSVTSNTILSSTSSLFTFALSMIVLKEPYSVAKLLSIAACMAGTLLVTLSDESSGSKGSSSGAAPMGGNSIHSIGSANITAAAAASTGVGNMTAAAAGAVPGSGVGASSGPAHSVIGDLLCLVSACFYAGYTIVLRKSLPDDEEANVALFFGYVGLLCSVVFAPAVAVLAGLGTLKLKTIPPVAYLIILLQGVLNYCLSDYLWAHAVLLLGPTVATLGLSVQIPVAAVVEVLIGHAKWLSSSRAMAMTLSGTGLIMVGFFAGNLAGGGNVYSSHGDRGDAVDECRRDSGSDNMADACNDDSAAGEDSGGSSGCVVIPLSTHASIRDRSPGRGASSSASIHTSHANGVSSNSKAVAVAADSIGSVGAVGAASPQRHKHYQQQKHQATAAGALSDASLLGMAGDDELQRRLSLEMSSFAGSSSNSSPLSRGQPSPAAVAAATVASAAVKEDQAGGAADSSPSSSNGLQQQVQCQQQLQDLQQQQQQNEDGSRLSPSKKPYRASRLGLKQMHYLDNQSPRSSRESL